MVKNYDESVEIDHNLSWPYIRGHPYMILIIGSSGWGKTNVLLNLIKHQQSDIDKIYLYVKNIFESRYQLLIIWKLKKSKSILWIFTFTFGDVYGYLGYNPSKKNINSVWSYDSKYES